MKKYSLLALIVITSLNISCKKTVREGDRNESKPIIPDFSWTGTQIAPAELTFNNLTQNGKTYRWDFNNGTSSTSANPSNIKFNDPGAYTVSLMAMKGDSKVLTSKVILIAENPNPVASFSYSFKNNISYAPATVHFTNESVNASGYEWDLNGLKDNTKNPNDITFQQPGNYNIKLIATKGNTKSAVFEEIITIAANSNPIANFQIGRLGSGMGFYVGQEIVLVNKSTNADTYSWDLGNNQPKTSTEESPIVKLMVPGINAFTLTAKKGSLTNTRTINIKVLP